MIGFLTNIAPIALGFVAKLFALKSQAAAENQKLIIQSLQIVFQPLKRLILDTTLTMTHLKEEDQ